MKKENLKLPIIDLVPNENNPRYIRTPKFKKLVKSIKDFGEMLEIRPVVVDENLVILGGNMRYRAMIEAGIKQVEVIKITGWSDQQKNEFIVKDNASFGEWDFDALGNNWENADLIEWGLDLPTFNEAVDYSILDEENEELDKQADEMTKGVKKALLIEFDLDHYDEAQQLVKQFREIGANVGLLLIEKLKYELEILNR